MRIVRTTTTRIECDVCGGINPDLLCCIDIGGVAIDICKCCDTITARDLLELARRLREKRPNTEVARHGG